MAEPTASCGSSSQVSPDVLRSDGSLESGRVSTEPVGSYSKILSPAEHSKTSADLIREVDWPQLPLVIRQMKLLIEAKHGVALAGPQIGYNKRIFVVRDTSEDPSNIDPWDICINPVWTPNPKFDVEVGEEGCLTLPGNLFEVERWRVIEFKWQTPVFDQSGKVVQLVMNAQGELVGGWARIAQHECDHLEGKLVSDVGSKIDQTKMLKETAALAGFTYDEARGVMLMKDPISGALKEVPKEEALSRILAAKGAVRERARTIAERVQRRTERALERKRIKQRRKLEKENRKRGRR